MARQITATKGYTMTESTYASELPPMINLKEAANILDVSVSTVRNWIGDGTLPAYRLGPRLIRVMVSDLTGLIGALDTFDVIELDA